MPYILLAIAILITGFIIAQMIRDGRFYEIKKIGQASILAACACLLFMLALTGRLVLALVLFGVLCAIGWPWLFRDKSPADVFHQIKDDNAIDADFEEVEPEETSANREKDSLKDKDKEG